MAQPESRLSRAIMAYLRAHGIFCFKVHGGPTMMSGLPDIIACVPIHTDDWSPSEPGHFVGFETKMPSGTPSPIQKRVHEKIREAHGQVFVVRSLEDVTAALMSLGWTVPPPAPDAASPDN
jgi:hypothetical protein